jgi:hypothetical protein
MHPVRTANALFRLLIAAAFGFMSLGHAPVMAFARANQPIVTQGIAVEQPAGHHHHVAAAHGHHAVQPGLTDDALPAAPAPEGAAICNAVACFVVIAPAAASEPASDLLPLGKLSPALARAMTPSGPSPLVPPPRLQA